jgi:hypothetical protein
VETLLWLAAVGLLVVRRRTWARWWDRIRRRSARRVRTATATAMIESPGDDPPAHNGAATDAVSDTGVPTGAGTT